MANMEGKNTFPIRPVAQLLEDFQMAFPELGIVENDFRRPSRERWQKFFVLITSKVFEINPDNLFYPPKMDADLEYPDLYSESMPLFNFTLAMDRLLIAAGMENFGVENIIAPDTKSLTRICSAIINFVQFNFGRNEVFEEIKQQNRAVIEQYQECQRKVDEVQQKIDAYRVRKAEQQNDLERLTKANEEKKQICEDLQSKAVMIKEHWNSLKATTTEKKTQIARLKEKVACAKEENKRLDGLIVQSPDRMKADMDHMRDRLNKLNLHRDDIMSRNGELKKKLQQVKEREQDCETAITLITSIREFTDNERAIQQETARLKESSQAQNVVLWELQRSEQELCRALASRQEKLDKMALQHGQRSSDRTTSLQEIQREKEKLTEHMTGVDLQKRTLLEKIKRLEAEETRTSERHQVVIAEGRASYNKLLEQLDAYHLNLSKAWQQVEQKIKQRS